MSAETFGSGVCRSAQEPVAESEHLMVSIKKYV